MSSTLGTISGATIQNTLSLSAQTTHPKYVGRLPQWRKCRDAFEGEDRIKAGGEKYLPKLKGQSDDEYIAYKHRALFYSITGKSLSALIGMATSADLKLTYTDAMATYFTGTTPTQFDEIYATLMQEVLLQSRCGVLIDAPEDGGNPYPVTFIAEDITNWYVDRSGKTTFVMIREEYEREIDGYSIDLTYRYIELRVVDGVYTQTIHEPGSAQVTFTPTFKGKTISYIPFYVVHPLGVGFVDTKPMLLDIANINISHYMSSADLEHGRHFTGLPTPVILGGEVNGELHIGSTKFLVIPGKADAKYLEFTGQGLQSLEKAMSEKQGLLASMSARLLDNSSRGSEAADAVKLRYASETASLKTVVKSVNSVLQEVYSTIAEMIRESRDSVQIILGTDFMETQLSPAEMDTLFEGYFKGAVSKHTLVYNMRKGRRLDPLRSDEVEMSEIERIIPTKPDNQPNPATS